MRVEQTRLTPPVLKRIGAPQSFDVQLPPVVKSLYAVREAVRKPQVPSRSSGWGGGETVRGDGDVMAGQASIEPGRAREARERKESSARARAGGKRQETGKSSDDEKRSQA